LAAIRESWGEDDDELAFSEDMAFPSIQDFTKVEEREADVLDMILAMVLQRNPPRERLDSDRTHFANMAQLHDEVGALSGTLRCRVSD